jgi:RNA polymerase sigma-70 factor, ECF subfamily
VEKAKRERERYDCESLAQTRRLGLVRYPSKFESPCGLTVLSDEVRFRYTSTGMNLPALPRAEITRLLREYSATDPQTGERLFEAIYPELRRLARSLMRRERPGHTLQPTELVHDAYMKLVDETIILARDRAHFLGIAARAMRQILVDHARRRHAEKRGGQWDRVTLVDSLGSSAANGIELLALDEAIASLAAKDQRAARVMELRIFGGLTIEEIAQVLDVSKRTIDADWQFARLWIARVLSLTR